MEKVGAVSYQLIGHGEEAHQEVLQVKMEAILLLGVYWGRDGGTEGEMEGSREREREGRERKGGGRGEGGGRERGRQGGWSEEWQNTRVQIEAITAQLISGHCITP